MYKNAYSKKIINKTYLKLYNNIKNKHTINRKQSQIC